MVSPEDSPQTKKASPVSTILTGADLPEDLIIDILSRLLVKSLLRFKAVCKRWYSLISNPSFIQLHLNLATKNPQNDDSYVIHTVDDKDNYFSLVHLNSPQNVFDLELPYHRGNFPPLPLLPKIILVGSCNGILCVTINGFCNDQFSYLWNPATKHSMLLPPTIIQYEDRDAFYLSLGFGFDPIANDYKVVRILELQTHSIRSEVYSANKNSWREIKSPWDFPYYTNCDVCVKGVLYWRTLRRVVTFDLNNEMFGVHRIPDYVHATTRLQYDSIFTEFKDSVAMIIDYRGEDSNNAISLWSIDDVYLHGNRIELGSWTRKFTFEVDSTMEWHIGSFKIGDILLVVKADEAVWFLFNPENKETENVPIPLNTHGIFRYIGSLVSVPGSREVQWKAKEDDNQGKSRIFFL